MKLISERISTDTDDIQALIIRTIDMIIKRQNKLIDLISANQYGGLVEEVANEIIDDLRTMDIE